MGDYRDLQKTMRVFPSDTASATKPPVRIIATPASTRYLIPFLNLQAPGAFPFEVSLREENLGSCIDILKTTQPSRTLCKDANKLPSRKPIFAASWRSPNAWTTRCAAS